MDKKHIIFFVNYIINYFNQIDKNINYEKLCLILYSYGMKYFEHFGKFAFAEEFHSDKIPYLLSVKETFGLYYDIETLPQINMGKIDKYVNIDLITLHIIMKNYSNMTTEEILSNLSYYKINQEVLEEHGKDYIISKEYIFGYFKRQQENKNKEIEASNLN